jgi:serine/threonine protein kinase
MDPRVRPMRPGRNSLSANYRARSQAARNETSQANSMNLFSFNRGILANGGNQNIVKNVQDFRNLYPFFATSLNEFVMSSYGAERANKGDMNNLLSELNRYGIDLNDTLKDIIDLHAVDAINASQLTEIAAGGFGAVYTMSGNRNRVSGKECLVPLPSQTAIKYHKKNKDKVDHQHLFRIFQENYLQNILSLRGPKFTTSDGRELSVVPRATCIRKIEGTDQYMGYMEKVEGMELFDVMNKNIMSMNPRANDELILNVMGKLAECVDVMYTNFRFVHNDMTQHNIIIHPSGNIHIIDFGMAMIQVPYGEVMPGNRPNSLQNANAENPRMVVITPNLAHISSKYNLNVSTQPQVTSITPYLDQHTIMEKIGKAGRTSAVSLFDLMNRSQDLFQLINGVMINQLEICMNMYKRQIDQKISQMYTKYIAEKRTTNPNIQELTSGEMANIKYQVLRSFLPYVGTVNGMITKDLFQLMNRIFYTYEYDVELMNGSKEKRYFDVLTEIYNLYIYYYSQDIQPLGLFGLNRQGLPKFIDDLAVPICTSILAGRGRSEAANTNTYKNALFIEVYDFVNFIRHRFVPQNVIRFIKHIESILPGLYTKANKAQENAANKARANAANKAQANAGRAVNGSRVANHRSKKGITWANNKGQPLEHIKEFEHSPTIPQKYRQPEEIERPTGPPSPAGKNPRKFGSITNYHTTNLSSRSSNAQKKRTKVA